MRKDVVFVLYTWIHTVSFKCVLDVSHAYTVDCRLLILSTLIGFYVFVTIITIVWSPVVFTLFTWYTTFFTKILFTIWNELLSQSEKFIGSHVVIRYSIYMILSNIDRMASWMCHNVSNEVLKLWIFVAASRHQSAVWYLNLF